MSKRKLSRQQAWRIEKVQEERARRAAQRDADAQDALTGGELGPEQEGLVVAHYGTQVAVEAEPTFSPGDAVLLFEGKYARSETGSFLHPAYDITPDGERFLMMKPLDNADGETSQGSTEIVVVQNWLEELERLVPVKSN